jgi:FkbM family methyltransferase
MLAVLRQHGVEPTAFLDRSAFEGQTKEGVNVLHPDDGTLSRETREEALVFVSISLDKEPKWALYETLKTLGYVHLKYAFPWTLRNAWEQTLSNQWKTSVRETFDLWEDEESYRIYLQNLSALLFDDDGNAFAVPSQEVQYFDHTIPLDMRERERDGMRFVDCGAFTGDTLLSLCSHVPNIEAYAGFEPMPSNLKKFVDTMEKLKDQIGTGVIFPCAVGAENGILNFLDVSSSSRASKNGEGHAVPVVRLDDVLVAFRPTFIKMDIEGAELDALEGTRRTIVQNKPNLAICLYHAIDHYWTIPLLLRSWVREYKFYLRTYSFGGMETVLYAVR